MGLTAVGAAGSMLNCCESLEESFFNLFFAGDPIWNPFALDSRREDAKLTCLPEKGEARPVFPRAGAKEPNLGWWTNLQPAQSMATVPPCYYCSLCVQGQTRTRKNTCLLVNSKRGQGPAVYPSPTPTCISALEGQHFSFYHLKIQSMKAKQKV